ncbi:hypothetical protein MKX03_015456 [Papaver bracteatum]|nr:hypothetical protein MKX03_015456 [Papaver bracteatum]
MSSVDMMILPQQVSLFLIISCVSMLAMDVCSLVVVDDNKSNERLVLLALKHGITQDPLGTLSSWDNNNDSVHLCQWKGVTCCRRHPSRVTMLNLASQKLLGSISPHIGNLSFLQDHDLHNNGLNGGIPQQLGRLFRLKKLEISYNYLEGEIPKNVSRCSNLIYLGVSDNELVGRIPKELGYLSNLKFMWLSDNSYIFGEVPTSLGNLSYLTILDLVFKNWREESQTL